MSFGVTVLQFGKFYEKTGCFLSKQSISNAEIKRKKRQQSVGDRC